MSAVYKLVGHSLCPYVQRVVMAMEECGVAFERTDINLDDKPDWLVKVSPFGRVPALKVDERTWLFDSSAIAGFVDRQSGGGLMPENPLTFAQQDAWMRYGDGMLTLVADIIYRDRDAVALETSLTILIDRLKEMEGRTEPSPYFSGARFGLLDAVMASLFRSFPVLDLVSDVKLALNISDNQQAWWTRVKTRPSVRKAVPADYDADYAAFIAAKNSYAGRVLRELGY